jgi:hypothetical protein
MSDELDLLLPGKDIKSMHTENDMLAIEPGSHHGGDEELGSVGVGPGIGHREKANLFVLQIEVLIWERWEKVIA